jgi:cytochrome c2
MRIDLETIEKIEKYLLGNMNPDEVKKFETEIANHAELKQAVEDQKNLMKAVEKIYVKQAAVKAGQRVRVKSFFKAGGLLVAIVVVFTLAYVGYKEAKKQWEQPQNSQVENIVIPDLKQGEVYDPGAFLPTQIFEIDGSKDTVIVGNQGVMIAIPAGSFVDGNNHAVNGKIQFELKEALDPGTMMMAGLSTFSNDQPLETGGMFYINAKANGEELKIGEGGILTSVPQAEAKPGMMMFDGVVQADGSINWVNPQETESFLQPIDMRALDFYPPGYVDKLKSLELYPNASRPTTMSGRGDTVATQEAHATNADNQVTNDNLYSRGFNYESKKYRDSLYLSFEQEYNWSDASIEIADTLTPDTSYTRIDMYGASIKGENLFKTYCVQCHYINDKKMIGPGLAGVRGRWGNDKKLYAFIKNPGSFLQTGDKYANELFNSYNASLMPSYNLSDEDIDNMMAYIESNANTPGISPSKVLAFWQPAFNNTFLATKEFESRMKLIHSTCNNAILDVYINNLDKKLYEVDSMAALLAGGLAPEFLKFAALKQGRVNTKDKKHTLLKNFYQKQAQIYAQAAIKTTREFFEKNKKADLYSLQESMKANDREITNTRKLFQEEFTLNVNEAYRQLGYPSNNGIVPGNNKSVPSQFQGNSVTANITTTGWKNVDRYTQESLIARTTLDYTDPNGRKAVIKFIPMDITITNESAFDLVNVYLIPDQLTTYMKVKKSNGKYAENLNELIKYDLVAVGYKNKQIFYQLKNNLQPGTYSMDLVKSDIGTVNDLLGSIGNQQVKADLKQALDYSIFQLADQERKNRYNQVVADREVLRPVIFPCTGFESSESFAVDSPTK